MRKSLLTLAFFSGVVFGQEVSFREELEKMGRYYHLNITDTQTLIVDKGHISYITPEQVIKLCSAFGGKAYIVDLKAVEGFGGRNYIEEKKIPAESRANVGGILKWAFKYAFTGDPTYRYVCEKDGQAIFRIPEVRTIGRYYKRDRMAGGDDMCYLHIAEHIPDKDLNTFYTFEREKALQSNSLIEFWRALGIKPKQLPDGSYKVSMSDVECSPFHANPALTSSAAYCYIKGGVFKTEDGQDFRQFIASAMLREGLKTDPVSPAWLVPMMKKSYYCDGPEKFMIYTELDMTSYRDPYRGTFLRFNTYYKQGIDLTAKAQDTQGQAQARQSLVGQIIGQLIPGATVSSQEIIASSVLTTARTKKPTINSVGSMQYQTVYLLPDGQCHLVASIAKGPGYTQVENHRVCGERIDNLGKSDDYKAFTVSRLAQDVGFSRNFYSTCRSYGEIVSSYQGYQVVCRAVNPNQPCFAEVLVLKNNKLVDVELGMDICTNIR